ncbi:MAG: NAD(P)-dependent oxidoreductase [Bryobacteraceae bacterium]
MILVTGAGGQVGSAVARHLRLAGYPVLASDKGSADSEAMAACDLRSDREVADLFRRHEIATVVHLAAVLPSAFRMEPLAGAEVNLGAAVRVVNAAVKSRVRRFIFASSASVYGTAPLPACDESVAPSPDEPYGAGKLAIEKVLEAASSVYTIEAVSLRIARVLGPGARGSGSPWRSRIFERPDAASNTLDIPHAPEARLSVVHVNDVARMVCALVETPRLKRTVYNTPVELMRTDEIQRLAAESNGWRIATGAAHGGPEIDGRRFNQDFGFANRPLREYFADACR